MQHDSERYALPAAAAFIAAMALAFWFFGIDPVPSAWRAKWAADKRPASSILEYKWTRTGNFLDHTVTVRGTIENSGAGGTVVVRAIANEDGKDVSGSEELFLNHRQRTSFEIILDVYDHGNVSTVKCDTYAK